MEINNLKVQLYYSKRIVLKNFILFILLTAILLWSKNFTYILVVVPFFIGTIVSLLHEVRIMENYNLKLNELKLIELQPEETKKAS